MSKQEKTEVVVTHNDGGQSTHEFNDQGNAEGFAKFVSQYEDIQSAQVKESDK